MNANVRFCGAGVLALASTLWLGSGSQREKALVSTAPPATLLALEADAAGHPDDVEPARALAQAYLDAGQPGLAVAFVAQAPPAVAADVRVRHVYARALIDEGRNADALAVEAGVVASCGEPAGGDRTARGCDPVLMASARRRGDILRQLVLLGVDDALAHPEESFVAYQNATREARVMLQ